MSAETAIYTALSAYAPLTAIVSTRIYPDVLPENCAYPAVVFSREKTTPYYGIGNQFYGADVVINVQCWSESRTQADSVAVAASAALSAAGMLPTGQNAGYDPETDLYASVIELEVFEN